MPWPVRVVPPRRVPKHSARIGDRRPPTRAPFSLRPTQTVADRANAVTLCLVLSSAVGVDDRDSEAVPRPQDAAAHSGHPLQRCVPEQTTRAPRVHRAPRIPCAPGIRTDYTRSTYDATAHDADAAEQPLFVHPCCKIGRATFAVSYDPTATFRLLGLGPRLHG